ncbi:hypothetical protein Q7C36_000568 [Tachysurus vachellii]|uniref:Uncharacterized protein n=1 Tax=Tachysurus vachellii TaxID=175792 RepID=A0AA88T896_TACVA|nr:hypothetical protein Q7C36_000568 [Tachysurus vachellii]
MRLACSVTPPTQMPGVFGAESEIVETEDDDDGAREDGGGGGDEDTDYMMETEETKEMVEREEIEKMEDI